MSTARDVMHTGAECVDENETLSSAAEMMRDLHVGAVPICGADRRLHGIITDRDIVVRCVAEGFDPTTMTAREMAQGTPIWVHIDDDSDEIVRVMVESGVRRVPVLENHQLVGMISEADLAVHLDEGQIAQFANDLYGAPPNS